MLSDERPFVRELGWRKIKKAQQTKNDDIVRTFKLPKLNFNCTEYYMISWHSEQLSEPPMTKVKDTELDSFIQNKNIFDIRDFPLHTQAVK